MEGGRHYGGKGKTVTGKAFRDTRKMFRGSFFTPLLMARISAGIYVLSRARKKSLRRIRLAIYTNRISAASGIIILSFAWLDPLTDLMTAWMAPSVYDGGSHVFSITVQFR